MRRLVATLLLVTSTATLAAPAMAASTRASAAIPTMAAQSAPPAAAKGQSAKPSFPDNAGIDRAREVADEHARFLRNDSEG